MIPLPLTALHDTLNAGDEPFTVLETVTPRTSNASTGMRAEVEAGVRAGVVAEVVAGVVVFH